MPTIAFCDWLAFLSSTPKHGDCLQKKKQLGTTLEQKLDLGLDRTLSAIVSYLRHVLTVEQKRTDFKPENDDILITNVTVVCFYSFFFLIVVKIYIICRVSYK